MKLTIEQVAQSLDTPLSTIKRWIRQGRIPVQKSGGGCVFDRQRLEKWAEIHNLKFSLENGGPALPDDAQVDNLKPAMQRGGVYYGIPGRDASEAIRSAVNKVPSEIIADKEVLYRRLLDREALSSTGIGKGVAIPHPRDPLPDVIHRPVITTCFLENSVDFHAVDDQPVFVMFILLNPSVKAHLHVLSRLAFCIRDAGFSAFLKTRPEPDALLSNVADFESRLDG